MMKIFLLISLLTSILLNGVEIEILISEQKLILKDSENIILSQKEIAKTFDPDKVYKV